MTLPSSGPLSLNDIKGEFGGPSSPSLANYYAGGSYVPSGTSGSYGAVPTSGTISIQNFYGTSASLETISLTIGSYSGIYGGIYGYDVYLELGSISPNTLSFSTPIANAPCDAIYYQSNSSYFLLSSSWGNVSPSCFTSLNANGTTFSSASATYYTDGSTYSEWVWFGVPNPIGTSGTVSCVFT